MEVAPDANAAYYFLALAQLGAGDTDAFRRTYASFVARLGNGTDRPATAAYIATLAVLLPNVDSNAARPLQFAQKASASAAMKSPSSR